MNRFQTHWYEVVLRNHPGGCNNLKKYAINIIKKTANQIIDLSKIIRHAGTLARPFALVVCCQFFFSFL